MDQDYKSEFKLNPDKTPDYFTIKFRSKPSDLTNVCIFSSYSFTGVVDEYVYYYLDALKTAKFSIIFISTSPLKDTCIQRLKQYAFIIGERENTCPDFGSWKAGISLLAQEYKPDSVLLANDSVFGPFYDLATIIATMKKRFDVWGMTDSLEIDYHLQSYFLYFNKSVIYSNAWTSFWQNVDVALTKQEVIDKYEIGLTKALLSAKFRLGAYANIDNVSKSSEHQSRLVNNIVAFWKILIQQYEFPFLKREVIIRWDINKVYWQRGLYLNMSGWRKVVGQTNYPVSYIDDFLKKYHRFTNQKNNSLTLQKRKILFLSHNVEIGGAQRVLLNFLEWFKNNTDIPFEIIACIPGKNQWLEEFEALANVTLFYTLSEADKAALKERLIDEQIALVFSNTMVNVEIQQYLSFLNVPQIVFLHELSYVLKMSPQIDKNADWISKNIAHFIACSNITGANLINYLNLNKEKVSTVHAFINDNITNADSHQSPQDLKNSLAIPPDAFIVGMCGTFEWRKAADLLPAIAASVCGLHPDIHLVWLGADKNSSFYEAIQFDLAKTDFKQKVHFISKQPDSRSFFQMIDVFVMASREDPFPIVNLESGLAGKPVICFENSGGAEEYIAKGTGKSVPYLNIDRLAAEVMNYYQDRGALKKANAAIPQIVRNNFTTNVQAPKIFDIIKNFYDADEMMLTENPSVTLMVHIYYDDSWKEIKRKLMYFNNGNNSFLFSISDACLAKELIIKDIKLCFKNSYTLVTSNIGKDIGGKLALIDLYLLLKIQSSFIIFLHDKQSPQTMVGELWKNNLYKIIEPDNHKKILQCFKNENIGIVGAKEHIINEYDSSKKTFRHNNDMTQKLLKRYNISITDYNYLSGTMYWLRSSIIKKFFSANDPISLRENLESGNVTDDQENTLTHTWERMFCWIAAKEGYLIEGI